MANEKKIDCVILGLLSHESKTGYEIKKRLDTTLKFFWGASYGSIYPSLSNLVKDERVTKYETKENGRDKVIYTITEAGREHLKEWLRVPVEKDEIRYETLLKLFFGNEIGKEVTLEHISNFKDKIEKEQSILLSMEKQLEQIKATEDTHLYYLLTAKFGVKVYKAYLEWCDETEQVLKNMEVESNE